ncbi:hypothetical protein KCP77_01670 [Salmonella enterica subsp. enterica]|nr:hypothetical protein KCP77_01670 [Salmonella enterica subsp. enterica]
MKNCPVVFVPRCTSIVNWRRSLGFASDLDDATVNSDHGQKVTELLKQETVCADVASRSSLWFCSQQTWLSGGCRTGENR